MKTIILMAVTLMIGCTTAGPYVTNISAVGNNGLIVEKCKVEYNALLAIVNTGDCYSSSIRLTNTDRLN